MAETYYQYLVLFELPVQPTVHFGMMNWLKRKTYSRCFLCLSLVFTSSCFIQRGYSTETNDIPSMISEENYWLPKYRRQTSTGETAQDKTQTSQKFCLQFKSLVMTQANQLQKNPYESWLMKTVDKISCDGLGNQDQQWESPQPEQGSEMLTWTCCVLLYDDQLGPHLCWGQSAWSPVLASWECQETAILGWLQGHWRGISPGMAKLPVRKRA